MFHKGFGIVALVVGAAMVACAGLSGGASPTATAAPGGAGPTGPNEPVSTPAGGSAPASGSGLDACQLVPAAEASALAGTSFDAGQSHSMGNGGSSCIYGSGAATLLTVEVIPASDQAQANQVKQSFEDELQGGGGGDSGQSVTLTELPDFYDGAVADVGSVSVGDKTVNASGLGVVKGLVFFGFSVLVNGGPAPSVDALKAEADKVASRLP